MELILTAEQPIYKRLCNWKEKRRDGLCATLATKTKQRFTASCFDPSGQILVLSDLENSLFAIDFSIKKYWTVTRNIRHCTVLASVAENIVIAGTKNGFIYIINIQSGSVLGLLKGHKTPIKNITFGRNDLCLTSTKIEAILWNLQTNTRVQVLNLTNSTLLKHAYFVPVSHHIFTSFDDETVHIWNDTDFTLEKQLQPNIWHNSSITSVAFSLDGNTMVFGFDAPCLALFLTTNYQLVNFLTLPDWIQAIKFLSFIPAPNDGGANKNLVILSLRGLVYFYNTETQKITDDLQTEDFVFRIDCSPRNNFLTCFMSMGHVCVFDVTQYVFPAVKTQTQSKRKKRCCSQLCTLKENIKEVLDKDKLKSILKEYGEYPDAFRMKIWEHLLELPNNRREYNAVINNRIIESFPDLTENYPLESKRSVKNLQKLLDNLVTWSTFFAHVEFLPVFVFPFVRMFYERQLVCFEVVCTILVNWCQHWFEYYPLPPVNILAMIENLLLEHDPELLKHFALHNVPSTLYAWPLLESNFSENVTASNWKIFWDHVLTNEPSFLLCASAAFNIIHRQNILRCFKEEEFKTFYYTHRPIDVRKLIIKSYHIFERTAITNHPRQYLTEFKKLEMGSYPSFTGFPKELFELKGKREIDISEDVARMKSEENELIKQRLITLEMLGQEYLKQEENTRTLEMENAILKKLASEQEQVRQFQKRLATLREKFEQEQQMIACCREKFPQTISRAISKPITVDGGGDRKNETTSMISSPPCVNVIPSKPKSSKKSAESSIKPSKKSNSSLQVLHEFQPEKWKTDTNNSFENTMKMLCGVAAVESIVEKIESVLKESDHKPTDDEPIPKLENDAKDLIEDINKLLQTTWKSGRAQSEMLRKNLEEKCEKKSKVRKSASY